MSNHFDFESPPRVREHGHNLAIQVAARHPATRNEHERNTKTADPEEEIRKKVLQNRDWQLNKLFEQKIVRATATKSRGLV